MGLIGRKQKLSVTHELFLKLIGDKPDLFIPNISTGSKILKFFLQWCSEDFLASLRKKNLPSNAVTLTFLQHSDWSGCTHTQMVMMDAIKSLDQLVDESDPDVDFPNSFHAFQTAEGIRQAHPDKGTITGRETENTHRDCVQAHP